MVGRTWCQGVEVSDSQSLSHLTRLVWTAESFTFPGSLGSFCSYCLWRPPCCLHMPFISCGCASLSSLGAVDKNLFSISKLWQVTSERLGLTRPFPPQGLLLPLPTYLCLCHFRSPSPGSRKIIFSEGKEKVQPGLLPYV